MKGVRAEVEDVTRRRVSPSPQFRELFPSEGREGTRGESGQAAPSCLLFALQLFPGLQASQLGSLSEEVLTWKRLGGSVEEEKEVAVFLILKCETGE